MAAATITARRWGFSATGGTDQTTVSAAPIKLKAIVVTSVGTAAGLATITTVTGTVSFAVLSGGTIGVSQVHNFIGGVELNDLAVTIGTTGHIVNFIVA